MWRAGALSCVLTVRHEPSSLVLHVLTPDGRALCTEVCADPDEAAARAEYLYQAFVGELT